MCSTIQNQLTYIHIFNNISYSEDEGEDEEDTDEDFEDIEEEENEEESESEENQKEQNNKSEKELTNGIKKEQISQSIITSVETEMLNLLKNVCIFLYIQYSMFLNNCIFLFLLTYCSAVSIYKSIVLLQFSYGDDHRGSNYFGEKSITTSLL